MTWHLLTTPITPYIEPLHLLRTMRLMTICLRNLVFIMNKLQYVVLLDSFELCIKGSIVCYLTEISEYVPQDCFDPIVDSISGRDLIPSMVYG